MSFEAPDFGWLKYLMQDLVFVTKCLLLHMTVTEKNCLERSSSQEPGSKSLHFHDFVLVKLKLSILSETCNLPQE